MLLDQEESGQTRVEYEEVALPNGTGVAVWEIGPDGYRRRVGRSYYATLHEAKAAYRDQTGPMAVVASVIDYEAIPKLLANEQDFAVLRGIVAVLLDEVEQRRQRLVKIAPATVPAITQAELGTMRDQLGQIHAIKMMQALGRDAFKGIEAMDVQIARAMPTK